MKSTDITRPAVPSALKYHNRELVLRCFRDHKEHTVADIVTHTGISKLTVMRAIQFFCQKNILISSGKGESTGQGGKPPEYFRLDLGKYLLAITMWPESLGVSLFNMDLQEIRRSSFSWIIPATPESAFAFVRENVLPLMQQAGISCGDLYGVSLSTAGIMDYSAQILKFSAHSPEWGSHIAVGQYLKEIFGETPYYYIENAGKCVSRAILDELEDPAKNTLVLFTTWGISGALIQDGHIQSGRDSLIGEIGHMVLDASDPEQCSCGSHGCMERLVSIARMRKRIAMDPPPAESPLSKLAPEAVNWAHLFFASQREDTYAQKQVAYLADHFATLLRNISLVFNPETVIFVGDFSIADEFFDRRIRQQFEHFRYLSSGIPMEIRYDTRLLTELDAKGGAIALLDHFFSDPAIYEDSE